MKSLLIMTCLMAMPYLAKAGDNGSYQICKSASGRTQLVKGNVGGGDLPESVELKIDAASIGQLVVEESVGKIVRGNVTSYQELDHYGDILLTIQQKSESRVRILGGMDPRTNAKLKVQIDLVCKTVYNPI